VRVGAPTSENIKMWTDEALKGIGLMATELLQA